MKIRRSVRLQAELGRGLLNRKICRILTLHSKVIGLTRPNQRMVGITASKKYFRTGWEISVKLASENLINRHSSSL